MLRSILYLDAIGGLQLAESTPSVGVPGSFVREAQQIIEETANALGVIGDGIANLENIFQAKDQTAAVPEPKEKDIKDEITTDIKCPF